MTSNKIKVQIVLCGSVLISQSSQDEHGEGLARGAGRRWVWGREAMAPSCGQSWLSLPRSSRGDPGVAGVEGGGEGEPCAHRATYLKPCWFQAWP